MWLKRQFPGRPMVILVHHLSFAYFFHRLCDHNDDVHSVAATCPTPITSQLVERMPEEVGSVLGVLWDCLSEMKDDRSSSVGFMMELLGMFMELILTEYSPCGRQAIGIRSFHCGFIQIGFRVSYPCCHVLYGNLERSIRISSLVPVLFPLF